MYFYLDKSLISHPQNDGFERKACLVRKIAGAVENSVHLMGGDYDVLEFFENYFRDKDIYVSRVFAHYRKRYADLGSVPSFIEYYLKVYDNTIHITPKAYGFDIPIFYLENVNLGVCKLLCEDMYDCEFFLHVLKWYKKEKNINVNTIYSCDNGGGATMANILTERIAKHEMTLAISDTDKKYPEQEIQKDSTCGKCLSVPNIDNSPLVKYFYINVQEIENIIPLNWLDKLSATIVQTKDKKVISQLYESELAEEVMPYFDLKRGLSKLRKEEENCKGYIDYVEKCYMLINKHDTREQFLAQFYKEKNICINGLAKSILSNCLILLKSQNMEAPRLKKFQKDEWCRIGQKMINFLCARNKEAIID